MRVTKAATKLAGSAFATFLAVAFSGCGGGSPPPNITVSVAASAQQVDQGEIVTVTASVSNDTSGKGVRWSVSCSTSSCGTTSSQTGNSVIYTAPNPVNATLAVNVTASSVADPSKFAAANVTVMPPPSVTTSSLPGATGGTVYNTMLQETGGVAPYTWALAGANTLPPGLELGTDGTISGTPTAGGTVQFTVQVNDSGSPPLNSSANLSITVSVNPISVTTTSLPDGSLDADYSQPLQASGGIPPYTWTITGGSPPVWATLDSNGTVQGIPGITGTSNFTVQVSDSETTALIASGPVSVRVNSSASANNSELKGQYAFLFQGWDDTTGSREAAIGSIVADGSGTISSGIEDENGPNGTHLSLAVAGTYYLGANNRGGMTLTTASGSHTYAISLSSLNSGVANRVRFIEYDDTTGTSGERGSGVMRMQDASAFSLAKISGPYAFEFSGQDAGANLQAIAGSLSADGAGTFSSGTADLNVAGTATNPSLSGTYTAPSNATGRATMKIIPSTSAALNFSVYVVSVTESYAMQSDAFSTSGILSGPIVSQSSTSFTASSLNAPGVYYQVGAGVAELGLLSPDGNGNLNVTYDAQSSSNGFAKKATFAATYTASAAGRFVVSSWHGDSTAAALVLYAIDNNKGFLLDTDASAGIGFVEPQTVPAGGFSNSSLSGAFSAVTTTPENSNAENDAGTVTLDGSSAFAEIADLNKLNTVPAGPAHLFLNQNTSGTYSIDSTGRGVVVAVQVSASTLATALLTLGLGAFVLASAGRRNRKRHSGPGIAIFSLALLFATTPAGCPPPCKTNCFTNQVVFYVISPQKAVMLHQLTGVQNPPITIVEQ